MPGHDVESVQSLSWSGIKNGDLLERAQAQFDLLITMDTNLPWQQDLARYDLAIIMLQAKSNR